jgi:ketosteroid isomerase-like protein
MKKLLMIIPLVILLCFTFGCQKAEEVAEEPMVDVEADVEKIKTWFENEKMAVLEADVNAEMELYTEDTVWMPPYEPAIEGKQACQQSSQQWSEKIETKEIQYPFIEIEIHGNWAYVRGTYFVQFIPKGGDEKSEDQGKFINLFRRQSDGSWKCTHSIHNSDNPPIVNINE